MQASPFTSGPIALTNTYTTNLLNPGTTTGGVNCTSAPYDKLKLLVKKIRVTNKTASAATFRLYKDATGGNTAGKEYYYDKSVAANSVLEEFVAIPLTTSDFLVGGASANTTLVIEFEGEIGVAF